MLACQSRVSWWRVPLARGLPARADRGLVRQPGCSAGPEACWLSSTPGAIRGAHQATSETAHRAALSPAGPRTALWCVGEVQGPESLGSDAVSVRRVFSCSFLPGGGRHCVFVLRVFQPRLGRGVFKVLTVIHSSRQLFKLLLYLSAFCWGCGGVCIRTF